MAVAVTARAAAATGLAAAMRLAAGVMAAGAIAAGATEVRAAAAAHADTPERACSTCVGQYVAAPCDTRAFANRPSGLPAHEQNEVDSLEEVSRHLPTSMYSEGEPGSPPDCKQVTRGLTPWQGTEQRGGTSPAPPDLLVRLAE